MGQKKVGGFVAVALVALVSGAGLERVRQALFVPSAEQDSTAAENATNFTPTVRTVVVTNTAEERAANEALRRHIAELEKKLADSAAAKVPAAEPPKPEEASQDRSRRGSFNERMEQLKKENPEQYAEMQKRREEFRQNMEQRAQDRANFLSSVDTQKMNDEQRENHEKLLATTARVDELRAQMEQAENGEVRDKLRQEMGESINSLGELYGAERRYLLEETGRAVGYQGSQASDFADQMQTIIDNTTMPNMRFRGMR